MVQGGQAVVDPMFERKEWNDFFSLKIHCYYKILKLKSLMNCYNEIDLKKIAFVWQTDHWNSVCRREFQ